MTIYNLDRMFKPSSVAIIGASERQGSIGYSLVRNVIDAEYQGKVIPVIRSLTLDTGIQYFCENLHKQAY